MQRYQRDAARRLGLDTPPKTRAVHRMHSRSFIHSVNRRSFTHRHKGRLTFDSPSVR